MNGRRVLGNHTPVGALYVALCLALVVVVVFSFWWRMSLRFGERQTKEEDTGAFPRCGHDIAVVWAAPLWWWWRSCRLGGSRQCTPIQPTFLHMHLAKKLLCLSFYFSLSLRFSLFVATTTTTTTSRHIGWVHATSYLSLEDKRDISCVCVSVIRPDFVDKEPLDHHGPSFFI